MRNNGKVFAGFLVALLAALPAGAETTLTGKPEQGGLVVGRTMPGTAVSLDGRPVPVDAEGRFLLGFSREAGPKAVLATGPETRELAVAPRQWAIQRVDGLPQDKVKPDPAQLARIAADAKAIAERRAAVSATALFAGGLAQPAEGPVSGVFGSQRILNGEPRAPHSGTDIAAGTGAPVKSVGDGVVTLAHPDMFLTGKTVMVDHGLGLQTVYAHLSRIDVAEGQRVAKGEVIGAVGASGRATGPHLHWGATWLDVKLDPETVMAVLGN